METISDQIKRRGYIGLALRDFQPSQSSTVGTQSPDFDQKVGGDQGSEEGKKQADGQLDTLKSVLDQFQSPNGSQYVDSSASAPSIGAGSTFGGLGAGGADSFALSGPADMFSFGGGAGASGAGASGAGASGAGNAGMMNPWTALALVIAGNEKSARNGGHRDTGFPYWRDLMDGAVVGQDTKERWNPKIDKLTGGSWGKSGLGGDMQFGADMSGVGGWGDAGSSWKKTTPMKWLGKLF